MLSHILPYNLLLLWAKPFFFRFFSSYIFPAISITTLKFSLMHTYIYIYMYLHTSNYMYISNSSNIGVYNEKFR